MIAIILQISVTAVIWICVAVFVLSVLLGIIFCVNKRADVGGPLIASGLIAFVIAGAQVEIENNRNLQADRQALEMAFAQTRDLTAGDLRNRDLHDFFIADKAMPYALLDGAVLADARLRCDNLELASAENAVATGAHLTGDDFGSADFQRANLMGAHVALAIGTHARGTPSQTNFEHANLSHSVIFNASLSYLDARDVQLDGSHLYDVDLRRANLQGASLHGAILGGLAYPRASLKPGDAGLGPVDLRGTNFTSARLEAADLRGAYLAGARFDGATADANTKLPTGFELLREGGRYVIRQMSSGPRLLPSVPKPESPCPPSSRPPRFG